MSDSNKQQQRSQKTKQISKEPKSNTKGLGVKDKRFISAEYDPKFRAPKQSISKVKIDKRFADKMKSENFKTAGSVDKYGRKQKSSEGLGGMEDYYYTEDNEKDQNTVPIQDQEHKKNKNKNKNKNKKVEIQEKEEIISEKDEQEIGQQQQNEQSEQKHGNNISKWMQEYNEESESGMDEQLDEIVEDSDDIWSESEENVVKGEQVQVTKRLALCNYDWMNINAKDLMLLFASFKPTAGTILSISVYYSQLGIEKMQAQQKYGPQGIWKDAPASNPIKQQKSKKHTSVTKKHEQQEAFNQRKLRAYEKQRLKYCYAVIECNSKSTADQIYKQCDGNQFQNSNLSFDLRFIPDEIKFDAAMLKEKCNEIPVSGEVKNFVSRALGHSSVGLTWEDPELNSVASLKKKNWNKMSEKQMDNIDWSMYINENAEIANDNLNKIIKKSDQKTKLKKQAKQESENTENVSDWRKQCNKKLRNKTDDIQITFTSGFDTQLHTKKESLNKQLKTRKQRWRSIQQQKKRKQQIQLLVQKSDKKDFSYNPNDDRFKAVLENPAYHIDPSNPKFDHRKIGAVFEQVVKKNRNKNRI